MTCQADDLRSLFLFEDLDDDAFEWLCAHGAIESFEPGWIYREGEPAVWFYALVEGGIAVSRRVGQDDVEVTRSTTPGVYGGAFQAYLGDRVPQVYNNSLRAVVPTRLFLLTAADFAQFMRDRFGMAVHLLDGLFFGVKNAQEVIGQRERLLALGSLSAGLTHELNNPASAAMRATASLRERVTAMHKNLVSMAKGQLDRGALVALVGLQEEAVAAVPKAQRLSPMETSDREDVLEDWLGDHDLDEPGLAPNFVAAGLDEDFLERVVAALADGSGEDALPSTLRWLNCTVETELLMNEITDATSRVSNLVGAARQYSQLDRAAWQQVDVHDLLDSTLSMMSAKLGLGRVQVVRRYDRSLPRLSVYAAALNQVWTNLIDNAVAAMAGQGTLTVRTSLEDQCALIEIADTGPGIPDEIRKRIFEPFFTTKPVGEGTGLGLDISWRIVVQRHHGDLRVVSQPGDTRFQVRLPLVAPEPES